MLLLVWCCFLVFLRYFVFDFSFGFQSGWWWLGSLRIITIHKRTGHRKRSNTKNTCFVSFISISHWERESVCVYIIIFVFIKFQLKRGASIWLKNARKVELEEKCLSRKSFDCFSVISIWWTIQQLWSANDMLGWVFWGLHNFQPMAVYGYFCKKFSNFSSWWLEMPCILQLKFAFWEMIFWKILRISLYILKKCRCGAKISAKFHSSQCLKKISWKIRHFHPVVYNISVLCAHLW